MRISVSLVVNLVADGMTAPQIVTEYPDLEEEDVAAFPVEERLRMVVMDGGKSHLSPKKHSSGRRDCTAFEGTMVGGKASCTIYSKRPEACRSFERGTADCAKARLLAGVGVTV